MALSNNPTRTITIEKAWRRETNRRIKKLKAQTNAAFKEMVSHNQISNADGDDYDVPESARRNFMDQLSIFTAEYLGQEPPMAWMNKYQQQSYIRGNESAMVMMYPTDKRPQMDLFGNNPAELPTNKLDRDTLLALYNRGYESTKLWASDMESRVGIIIEVDLQPTRSIAEVEKLIDERIAVFQSRNNVISQTETIQANQLASINAVTRENQRLNDFIATMFTDEEIKKLEGGEIGDLLDDVEAIESPFEKRSAKERLTTFEVAQFEAGGFRLRWVSRADSKVRELHRRFHGRVMTPEQAKKNVTISPWNCRCALIAQDAKDVTPAKNRKWNDERKELLKEPKNG